MSEKLNFDYEQQEHLLDTPEQHKALPDPEHAEALRPGEKDPVDLLEARQHVAEVAENKDTDKLRERLETSEDEAHGAHAAYVDRALRQISLRREMQHVQRSLPTAARAFSKVVHQPVIRSVSSVASGSISRPSGLLGGGLVALLGTSSYLYYAKHVGFAYNYFVFFLLFIAGFAAGLLLELAVHIAMARRN